MERILIFGNTHESREAAQTMRRRGKQVIVCVTTEYARAQLPPGTLCHIGRFDDGQMLSTIAHRYEPEMLIFGDVFVLTYKTAEV